MAQAGLNDVKKTGGRKSDWKVPGKHKLTEFATDMISSQISNLFEIFVKQNLLSFEVQNMSCAVFGFYVNVC